MEIRLRLWRKVLAKEKNTFRKHLSTGEEIFSPFISHQQIMEGATLKLDLGELPNKEWGKNAVMPK